jgi:2-polyprenyl-3-methyl-5-hydroxy-6-metoxy-1,4-benzoquinol methylase
VTVYADLVARHGLAESHGLLLESVPEGARVLDVGCAEGYLARALVERGCTVVGVEFDPRAAEVARGVIATVVTGSVEDEQVRSQVPDGPYDRILFGDVLEHLARPGDVLRWAAGRLSADGRVVLSVPNVAHWTGRRALARGRFPREDHGLFDRTHLQFFTRETARALVEDAGLEVVDERFPGAPLPLQSRVPALAKLGPRAVAARPELFALQIVLVAQRRLAP